ncbi:MAG TPA: Gfo/Idh/MocA family oxidoreductase [Candidatus Limnocylindria bacterium]|nr:Gfo/Idh/MocA family oxidoreductase [Candidatus Limnocylindria bacterium]
MNAFERQTASSRREFLRTSSTVAALAAAAPAILIRGTAFAANSDTLKIGLVGCGGRGSQAAADAMTADGNTVITAIGDVFPEQLKSAVANLTKNFNDRVQLPPEKQFIGLDAYQKVIDSGVDVVLLATPPGFRPTHLRYAIEKGKHVFAEKPLATDAPGLRHVIESLKMSKEKGLSVVSGYCWRSDLPRRAFYEQVHQGTLGDLVAVYGTYLTGPVKPMQSPEQRKPEVGDLEWQLRNWMNFTWLSGDGIVEQCIHTVDKVMWAFKDEAPIKCSATGGRVTPNYEGNIYDHVTVVYEWADGRRAVVAQRQIPGCHNDNSDYILGSKGKGWSGWNTPYIKSGEQTLWRYKGKAPNMYEVEHQELFAGIRSGKLRHDGDWMAQSTLVGIMGRMAGYTGQEISFEQAMNSKDQFVPETIDWKVAIPPRPVAVQGRVKPV